MELKDIITVVLSSTLISTFTSSFFAMFSNRKKDVVENITKERKTWRDELRVIQTEISKSSSLEELGQAIDRLKVRINAYGIACNLAFSDFHIWKQIRCLESYETLDEKSIRKKKIIFINLISCLLKYDWERSKEEIRGNTQSIFVILSLIASFCLYSIRWFYYYNIGSSEIVNFISYTTLYSLFVAITILIMNFADKWRSLFELISYIVLGVFGISILIYSFACLVSSSSDTDVIDYIIFLAPFITLLFSAIFRLLRYRSNVNRFILSSTLAADFTKIDKKYKVFFSPVKISPLKNSNIQFEDTN